MFCSKCVKNSSRPGWRGDQFTTDQTSAKRWVSASISKENAKAVQLLVLVSISLYVLHSPIETKVYLHVITMLFFAAWRALTLLKLLFHCVR